MAKAKQIKLKVIKSQLGNELLADAGQSISVFSEARPNRSNKLSPDTASLADSLSKIIARSGQ